MKKIFSTALCFSLLASAISCNNDDATPVNTPPETINDSSLLAGLLSALSSNDTSTPTIIDDFTCFNIQLPVQVTANGQQLTITTEADYALIEAIFNQSNFDEDSLEFTYPLNVIDSNYQVISVADEQQLDTMANACADNGIQDILDCISLNYPVTLLGYSGSMVLEDSYIINSDAELQAVMGGLGDNENYAIQYPVSITYNGQVITATSNDSFVDALQLAVADCQANSCDTSFTVFQQAYGALSTLPDVVEEFTMDALIHEYTFAMAQSGTICSIGYKAEYQPNPIPYLIEITDANDNVIYSGNHSFSTTMMEYISIPPVTINANQNYTIRRSVASYNVGMGIGTLLIRSQNWGAQQGILPYTQGDITISHARFYGGGGSLDPEYHMLPMIDFVFKPL